MKSLFVVGNGKKIGVKYNRIYIEEEDNIVAEIPLFKIDTLYIVGKNQLTADALVRLVKNNCKIVYTTNYGRFKALIIDFPSLDPITKFAQIRSYENEFQRLTLAREFARAKLHNIYSFLEGTPRAK